MQTPDANARSIARSQNANAYKAPAGQPRRRSSIPAGAGAGRRRPAAQQPAALPDLLLQHRAPGRLPAAHVTSDATRPRSPCARRPTTTASSCWRSTASTRAEELDQVEWAPGSARRSSRMQFDAQDTQYRAAQPGRLLRRDRGRRRARRPAYVDRRPGRSAHRRHRAAAGVPRSRDRRRADRRAAGGGRRGGPHRQHPRRGAQPRAPGSTSGSASWSPTTSASTDGWSGRRERARSGERRLVAHAPARPARSARGTGRGGRGRRGRGRRSPAAAPARAVPRKTSENCSRCCPSGPAPPALGALDGLRELHRDRRHIVTAHHELLADPTLEEVEGQPPRFRHPAMLFALESSPNRRTR